MIPVMSWTAAIPIQIYEILDRLMSSSLFRFPPTVSALFLRLVMRVGLFMAFATFSAEEEQNLLRVARSHILSVWHRPLVVKHTARVGI
jgi:hypothetical protein